uniref:Uncharacterized protein n=1 Tax=Anguilla anguilla TaxID=7936 RepID=A0A0E9RM32_ANGAN
MNSWSRQPHSSGFTLDDWWFLFCLKYLPKSLSPLKTLFTY